jgi:SAM-dependent methyltransferase
MLTDHGGLSPLILDGYDKLAERIAHDGAKKVLDWGCGFAHLTRRLLDRGLEAEAYDYVPGLEVPISRASSRYPDILASLSPHPVALPYADGAFDAVASVGTLEHVCDPISSISEIHRVLRSGGTFYICRLPNRYSYIEFLARHLGRYYHGKLENDRTYTLPIIKALLNASGFEVRESGHVDMLPLTYLGSRCGPRCLQLARTINIALSRIPLLNLLSTNLELTVVRS